MVNFFSRFLQLLPAIPAIVMGVEQIYGGVKAGADKKDIAMASLGLSSGVAGMVLPEFKTEVEASTQMASAIIDAIVAGFNKAGWSHPAIALAPTLPLASAPALSPAQTAMPAGRYIPPVR